MRKFMTAAQKKEARSLFLGGLQRNEVAIRLGVNYHQVCHALKKVRKSSQRKQADASAPQKDYRALYFKALAILVENQLIEVEIE